MTQRILLAEDSATQAERLRELLEREGYGVDVATDGEAALAKIRSDPPDLVVSDVVMPRMDGYALCRAIRSFDETRYLPIVLLTSRGGPEDIIKGLENGADNFIVKPFEDEDLLRRIARIFDYLTMRTGQLLMVEITLGVGGRRLTITADKQQIVELLFATAEQLGHANTELERSQATLKRYVDDLERRVEERTRQLTESLESLKALDKERRQLLSSLLSAQEEERRSIARDIHDDSIQVMAAVTIRLATLRRRADPDLESLFAELERAATESISRLRRLMFELSPPTLESEGIVPALREHLEHLGNTHGFGVSLGSSDLDHEPPMDTRMIIYRISREALTNIGKHANAANVDVQLRSSDRGVTVRIHDDGAGFSTAGGVKSPKGHFGLTSMFERAEMAGGWCRVDSAGGRGTTVEFWLPEGATNEVSG